MYAHQHHFELSTMGTVVTADLSLSDRSPTTPERVFSAVTSKFDSTDHDFSTYRPDSLVSRYRRDSGLESSSSALNILISSLRPIVSLTRGYFDPWAIPGGFDPSGYVKGATAESAARSCDLGPSDSIIINAAGDIYSTSPIRAGVVSPTDPSRIMFSTVFEGALATSGDYLRPGHLYNPRQRSAQLGALSATVSGPDAGLADALATALCVGGPELLDILESLPLYSAILVLQTHPRPIILSSPTANYELFKSSRNLV